MCIDYEVTFITMVNILQYSKGGTKVIVVSLKIIDSLMYRCIGNYKPHFLFAVFGFQQHPQNTIKMDIFSS